MGLVGAPHAVGCRDTGTVIRLAVEELAQSTAQATDDVGTQVTAIQTDAATVVQALAGIRAIVDRINETQTMISGVLTEQAAGTRSQGFGSVVWVCRWWA